MKRLYFMLLLIVLMSSLFANTTFREGIFIPNTIVVCFDADAINTRTGDISIEHNSAGQVQIGLPSFDQIARDYNFTNIHRMLWVKDQDFCAEDGSYPMNIFSVTLKDNAVIEKALKALMDDTNIIWAEFEAYNKMAYTPNDPLYNLQWHLRMIDAPEMWNYVKGDSTIILAVIDSGVKWNHPDLRENIYINWAEAYNMTINWDTGTISGGNCPGNHPFPNYPLPADWSCIGDDDGNGRCDDAIGWDFCHTDDNMPGGPFVQSNQSYQSYDGRTHGTHVAGCAAAEGDNLIGVTGVAMNLKILVTKHSPQVWLPNTDQQPWARLIFNGYQGIYYAAEAGAHVINCSWGGSGNANQARVSAEFANARGSIIVAAAGNENLDLDTYPHYPSDEVRNICVAASNSIDLKANFSNYGTAVDVTAPGQNIMSTYYEGSMQNATNTYSSADGTSMASPVAAGAVAMMISTHPYYDLTDIRQRIFETCDPMEQNQEGPYAEKLGGGRLNARRAALGDLMPAIDIYEVNTYERVGDGDGIPNIGETISLRVALSNEPACLIANNTVATLIPGRDDVQVISGTVNYGTVYPSAVAYPPNTDAGLFVVNVGPTVNTLEVPMILIVTANQEPTYEYNYTREIHFTMPISMQKPNWPLEHAATAPPVVADLDGSGNKLISVSYSTIHIVNPDKTPIAGFPLTLDGNNIFGKIAVGNMIPGNPNKQLVVFQSGSTGIVRLISHTGEIIAERETGSTIRTAPIIADLNNDGQIDIVVSTMNRNLHILNGNDLSYWSNYPIDIGLTNCNLAIGDVNNDGIKNIVLNGLTSGLQVINPITGENIAGFPMPGIGTSNAGASLVNLDGDPDLEIVYATSPNTNPTLYVIKSNGTILRQTTNETTIRTEIATVNLYNGGPIVLVYGDDAGYIHIRNHMLEYLPNYPVNVGASIRSSAVFSSLDGTGGRAIIFCDESGYLHALKQNGQYVNGYPIKVSSQAISHSPWVGKFDNNQTADILLGNTEGMQFFDHKGTGGFAVWNSFRGNLQNTACWTDPSTTPDTDTTTPILTNALNQNYPNPFNPSTTIQFSTTGVNGKDAHITIEIYNIKGQKVKTLVNDTYSAGNYSVVWNGKDDSERNVSSGIYFYKLKSENHTETKKMMLMK